MVPEQALELKEPHVTFCVLPNQTSRTRHYSNGTDAPTSACGS